jgi:hypothetical protein
MTPSEYGLLMHHVDCIFWMQLFLNCFYAIGFIAILRKLS